MSIENIAQAKAELEATAAYKILNRFFDEDTFCQIDTFAKSADSYAEAVAGYGTVDGLPVYAFAQNSDIDGGAMSKAQAAKLLKLYDLAEKTGVPVVGFYDSMGGKLAQGNELLKGYGDLLHASSRLSGVVPQVSVILGDCLGTNALIAANSDIVIMSEKAQLSVDTSGTNSSAAHNSETGVANVLVSGMAEAVNKARDLIGYLPSNNLNAPPAAFEEEPDSENTPCLASAVADANSMYEINGGVSGPVSTAFGRIGGMVVGFVGTKGEEVDCKSAGKIAKMVRFCDAFSIPVISFVNSKGFGSLKSAGKVTAAYAEATTAKISVVCGTAVGAIYLAMAGSGANTDMTFALPEAVISPINPEAAAFILSPETMNVPVQQQRQAAQDFASSQLSALKAAENGYIEDIVTMETMRSKLISALDMLASKRVPTLAKKHGTI